MTADRPQDDNAGGAGVRLRRFDRTMTCSACRSDNLPASAFCEECGAPLERRCPSCGTVCKPTAKFCRGCGASLAVRAGEATPDVVARKVITIVFADLIGSTSLHERLDPESVSRVMDHYYRTVRGPIEAHGGTVVQLLGDGVMCAFGVPRVAEDDAIRAVRAAVAVQQAFRAFARQESALVGRIGLRIAVNTGEVVVSDDHAAGIGDPLNVAARLQQEAHDGDVLIGESTRRLVGELVTLEPFGVLALKGRAETVAAFRVVSLVRPKGASATAFVGREDELRRIMAVYDAAVIDRRARLAVILGSPGLGKSRLMDEVARRLGDGATVLAAQCDAAGGATFAPVARALRALLAIEDGVSGDALRVVIESAVPGDDPERRSIADGITALLAGTPASPEETFFVVRRFLAVLARARPVVLVIDDLHWAEPLLLDLTEHLVQWGSDVPLLVLAAARPELREVRSSLAAPGGLVADVVTLAGLDAGAATRLAANVIGAAELPAAVAGRVLATSEGNPLFVGELVRMLVHDGALKREGDRWVTGVELAGLEMPPTIQALLAARIERLRPGERTVLERAAVVGRQFSRAAVTHLLPQEVADLDARFEALRRSELIEPDMGWFLGEPGLRFHHVLIRDAAYRRVLKNTRAELHARFADWLEARVGEAVEHDETIGWHLEQAHQHLRELGPIDDHGRALGERAARYLAAAGRRALARDDLPLAANLLGRALARLDPTDPARADLALDWCEALLAAGDVGPAEGAIGELGKFMGGSERLRAWHTCFSGQLAALTDPQALRATADTVAAAAETLAALGDAAGEAKAHFVQAVALARLGKVGACEAALDRALAAARRAGDRRRSNAVLAGAPLAALWGPSPVTRASGRCLDVVRVLRITQGAPAVEAVALRCQGALEALRGRTEAARRMIASSRRMVEELGITHRLLEADVFASRIELLEGDAVAAERWLRAAYEGLRDLGLGIDAAQAAALLGRALLAQGRAADAETLSHESEALAGDDLQAAIAWRGVRAEALARRGEHAVAIDFARAAVDIAAATDALLDHADARVALAVALRAAGRYDEAAAEEGRAIELWQAKGATLLAERACHAGARARPEPRTAEDRGMPMRPTRRRVRGNAATAQAARLAATMAARDAAALPTLLAERVEVTDHATGATYDRQGLLATWQLMLGVRDLTFRSEPLATLGDSLALIRESLSATGVAAGELDVGAYEIEVVTLGEIVAGKTQRVDTFPLDRLGDAVVRLYERYAELLPDGPARVGAAATAHSLATLLILTDLSSLAAAFDPAIAFVDHRPLGLPTQHGIEQHLKGLQSLQDVSDGIDKRIDDVLALQANAFLVRWTQFGTARAGGGAYERTFLCLYVFGPNGLAVRNELFAADREAEALARFDQLTSATAIAASGVTKQRRAAVRANAAIANVRAFEAAVAARDADAFDGLVADDAVMVDHPTGTELDRSQMLRVWRSFLGLADLTLVCEPLATLGDSLALCRQSLSASGIPSAKLDFGAFEREEIILVEVDPDGRRSRTEFFATRRLGDALVRLYERYAARLPDGPERARAAATARSNALVLAQFDLDCYATAYSPAIEADDHRTIIGWGPVRGVEEVLKTLRALVEVAADITTRVDDVLALRPDGSLLRWTNSGTERVGGGVYERHFLLLWVFGADGFVTRYELFDSDRDAEALARFEELFAEPTAAQLAVTPARPGQREKHRVRPNAASAFAAGLEAALVAGDADALSRLVAERVEVVDHTTGLTADRDGFLREARSLLKARGQTYRLEPLATLGEALLLCRSSMSASGLVRGNFDVGPYEREVFHVLEVDGRGRLGANERFAAIRLGDAIGRLYERWAERLSGGPARARAAATARAVAAFLGPFDLDRIATAITSTLVHVDHRRVIGMGSTRGASAFLDWVRSLTEVVGDVVVRVDDTLGLRPDVLLTCVTVSGIAHTGGGTAEAQFLSLMVFGQDGLVARLEHFDPDQSDRALARFDELTGASTPPPLITNAATRHIARFAEAWAARDWSGVTRGFTPGFRLIDRRSYAQLELDRDRHFESLRMRFGMSSSGLTSEVLATRGERLALGWQRFDLADHDVGPSESESLWVSEVDAHGDAVATVMFDSGDLDAAFAELDARYAAGEAAPSARDPLAALRIPPNAATRNEDRCAAAFETRDLKALEAQFAPSLVFDDRRRGILLTGDRETLIASIRHMAAAGTCYARTVLATAGDCLALERHRYYRRRTEADGEVLFEVETLQVKEVDAEGRAVAIIVFDPDDRRAASEEMVTRFGRTHAGRWARALSEVRRGVMEHDLARVRAALPDDFFYDDHRRARGPGRVGPDEYVAWIAPLFEQSPDAFFESMYQVAAAEHGAIDVGHTIGTLAEGGPFESIWVMVAVFRNERIVRVEMFEPEDLDVARARFEELRPDPTRIPPDATAEPAATENAAPGSPRDPFAALARPNAATRANDRLQAAFATRDWSAMRAAFAEDARIEEPRYGIVSYDAEGWVTVMRRIAQGALGEVADWRYERQLVGTAGERVDLARVRWAGVADGGPFETATLLVTEVDENGLIVALVSFNADDSFAATREAWTRMLARDTRAALVAGPVFELSEGINGRDRARLRAVLADDLVVHDRRRAGMGLLESADAYVESIAVLWDLAPDVRVQGFLITYERHGQVGVGRTFGTLAEGGPFESYYVNVTTVARGRITRIEFFEVDDVDAALARFTELRPGPLYIPPNAASRVRDRISDACEVRDWQAVRALTRADFTYDERNRRSLLSGDVELWVKSLQFIWSAPNARVVRTLIGTAGDRIALGHSLVTGGRDASAFEAERIVLTEIDADGKLVATIAWDVEDRAAAFTEAHARFVAGEAAGIGGQAPGLMLDRAIAQRDWEAVRGVLAPDLVVHDHRPLGLGAMPHDQFVEWVRALTDLAPDAHLEILYILAWNRHGGVNASVMHGTVPGGGPFENVGIGVSLTDGDRITCFELFDLADVDRALARFEELCAARARNPAA